VVNRRDEALAKGAIERLLMPGLGVQAKQGASAILRSLGIDEHTALAEAREARQPLTEPLRKDSAAGGIVVRSPMDSGHVLRLEMSPSEAVSLAVATQDAITRGRAR
jgi:hypothetical protein